MYLDNLPNFDSFPGGFFKAFVLAIKNKAGAVVGFIVGFVAFVIYDSFFSHADEEEDYERNH